jgi:RNA-directed DNA polymerase
LAHRTTEPLGQKMRGLGHRHPRIQQLSGRIDPPGALPGTSTPTTSTHDTRILLNMSQSVCDTPRPFQPLITQRDLKLEVAQCVGGVISPLLSNIYLHVFDEQMTRAGFQLTRYADDWLCVCRTREEAERALASARAVLEGELGLRVHPEKTRIVHVSQGFEFLGYKIGLGRGLRFKSGGIGLYAIPRQRSIDRFKDKVRALTRRRIAVPLEELIHDLNSVIRGWGMYYRRAHVRRLFNRLNMWIVRRIWGWRFKRWRNAGWRTLPEKRLYGEYRLVNLLQLIPSMRDYYRQKGYSH